MIFSQEEAMNEMYRIKISDPPKLGKLASTDFYAGKALKKFALEDKIKSPFSRFVVNHHQ
jgi:hypothetical protein